MPWDEIVARDFPSLSKDLDGISRKTMEDHYKLYQGYVKKTNELRGKLKEIDYAEAEGNQVYSELRALATRSEEHTSELQSRQYLVCRLLLEKKKKQRCTTTLDRQQECITS